MSAEIEVPTADAPAARARPPARTPPRITSFLVLLVVWLGSALYVLPFVDRGWIPHDEGTLAQSAERVAEGQVPHRDFDEGYTGLLSHLHALAFQQFGASIRTLRFVLFGAFLLFVPAVYAIARRALSPLAAALATFACVLWTVPNYFSSMPSWYNLFLAVFGAYSVLRHIESGRLRWLFAAGLFGGLSILVKVVGLYYVAAVLLFLAWREMTLAASAAAATPGSRPRSAAFSWAKTLAIVAFVVLAAITFRSRLAFVDLLHFVVPPAALGFLLVRTEWRDGRGTFLERAQGLARLTLPFLAGVAAPIAVFVLLYARLHALPALVEGIVLRPQRQLAIGKLPFLERSTLLAVLPYAALLAFPALLAGRPRRFAVSGLAALLAVLLWTASTETVYGWIWMWARTTDVVVVLAGAFLLARRDPGRDPIGGQRLFLMIALAGCMGFIQFPFSAPIYFCYAVPFTIFALAFLVAGQTERIGWAHLQVLGFALGFALLYLNPGYIYFIGRAPGRYFADGRLAIPRAGLRVGAKDARDYAELVSFVREKSGSSTIYAGPEAPEVYFLCAKPNATRILFESVSGITPTGDTATLSRFFERDDVRVVVWNRRPEFTHGLWRVYRERLGRRFPNFREIGKFTVMWRDGQI